MKIIRIDENLYHLYNNKEVIILRQEELKTLARTAMEAAIVWTDIEDTDNLYHV